MEPTEAVLLAAQRGDKQALASFLIWCTQELNLVVRRKLPKDAALRAELVSEARILLMENLKTFEWMGINPLRAYLNIALKAALKKHLRSQARNVGLDEVTDHGELSGSSDSLTGLTARLPVLRASPEQQRSLNEVMGALKDQEGGAMLVAHYVGYTKREIGDDHGMSGTAVAKKLKVVQKRLSKQLK